LAVNTKQPSAVTPYIYCGDYIIYQVIILILLMLISILIWGLFLTCKKEFSIKQKHIETENNNNLAGNTKKLSPVTPCIDLWWF